jgi:DNA mismatch repair ATPase MutS
VSDDISISEAKELVGKLEQLILKLGGTKHQDGSVSRLGLISQIEELSNRLNPTTVSFASLGQQREYEKVLQSIDQLLEKQKSHIEEISISLKSDLDTIADEYIEDMRKLGEKTLSEWIEPATQELEKQYQKLDSKLATLGDQKVAQLQESIDRYSNAPYWMFSLGFVGALSGGIIVKMFL